MLIHKCTRVSKYSSKLLLCMATPEFPLIYKKCSYSLAHWDAFFLNIPIINAWFIWGERSTRWCCPINNLTMSKQRQTQTEARGLQDWNADRLDLRTIQFFKLLTSINLYPTIFFLNFLTQQNTYINTAKHLHQLAKQLVVLSKAHLVKKTLSLHFKILTTSL